MRDVIRPCSSDVSLTLQSHSEEKGLHEDTSQGLSQGGDVYLSPTHTEMWRHVDPAGLQPRLSGCVDRTPVLTYPLKTTRRAGVVLSSHQIFALANPHM